MMATTRAKASSVEKAQNVGDLLPMSVFKEFLQLQEKSMKEFFISYVTETNALIISRMKSKELSKALNLHRKNSKI